MRSTLRNSTASSGISAAAIHSLIFPARRPLHLVHGARRKRGGTSEGWWLGRPAPARNFDLKTPVANSLFELGSLITAIQRVDVTVAAFRSGPAVNRTG